MMLAFSGCSRNIVTVDELLNEIKETQEGEVKDEKLEADDIILRVEDQSLTYGEVQVYIYQAKLRYEETFSGEIWDVSLEDGNSFEKHAKEEILREVTEALIICQEAKDEDVELTKDEKAKVKEKAKEFLARIEESTKTQCGIEARNVERVYEQNALVKKMYEKIVANTGDGSGEAFEEAYAEWSKDRTIDLSMELWKKIRIKTIEERQKG